VENRTIETAAAMPSPTQAKPAADQAVYVMAFRLLRQGRPQPQAIAELSRSGVDGATAATIVARVGLFINALRAAYRDAGLKNILYGFLWCVGGMVVTAVTYSMASGGGTYVVAWGAVLFGFIQAIRGLFTIFRQPSESDVARLSAAQ